MRYRLCSLILLYAASTNALLLGPNTKARVTTQQQKSQRNSKATPIDGADWPDRFPAKSHCSRCGLCETSYVSKVMDACAFLGEGMARMDVLEEQFHGRRRNVSDMIWSADKSHDKNTGVAEEGRFGVLYEPVKLAQGVETNAQWTGCVTGIALSMLESNMVDAVVCIASQNDKGWASPEPIIAKTPEDVLRGRGVKVRTIVDGFKLTYYFHINLILLTPHIRIRIASVGSKSEGVGRDSE
jgi:hypothetical protein